MADPPLKRITLNQRVGDGVRAELARSGMSQATLARHLGIGPNALRRRMNDDVSFTIDDVDTICRLFGIGPHELIRQAIAFASIRITAREVFVQGG